MKFLGTDLALTESGDMMVKDGDIALVEKLECLQANLLDRLLSARGDLILHPEFGSNLEHYVSQPLTQALQSVLKAEIKFQILEDPRVKEVLDIEIDEIDFGLKITAKVIIQDGQVIENLVFPYEIER